MPRHSVYFSDEEEEILKEANEKFKERNGKKFNQKEVFLEALQVYNSMNSQQIDMAKMMELLKEMKEMMDSEEWGEPGVDVKAFREIARRVRGD